MVKDWEQAQQIVASFTGGKIPPGSGNGRIKGDVVTDTVTYEVKQTSKETITLKKSWFYKLSAQSKGKTSCLVIFFELRGYPYVGTEPENQSDLILTLGDDHWETTTLTEDKLPKKIFTKGVVWELYTMNQLRDL